MIDDSRLVSKSTEGSWRAGRNHALAGYAMPVDLTPGFQYYQEFAPEDDALDEARTFAILDRLNVGATTYRNVLQVLETTAVEPDTREFKFYAPGVGLIRAEEELDMNLANPGVTFNRVEAAPVPLPPTSVPAPRRARGARPRPSHHHDLGAHGHAVVEVDHVLVQHPEAARGGRPADALRRVGAVDAVAGVVRRRRLM